LETIGVNERTPRPQVGVCSFLFSLFKCPTAYAEGRLCKRSVELIHRLLAALPDNALRRIDSLLKRLCQNLLICLVIGIIAGVVVAFILKGQLKTVRKQNQANVYVKPGSMQVTVHNDFFLYRDVTRTKKQSSSSSGSGSSRSTGGGSF
jgi:uncharacterized membrane protein YgcG